MRGLRPAWWVGMALAAACASVAFAQSESVEFPAGTAPAELTPWLKRNTDLELATIIAITPTAVTGVLSSISTPAGPTIRQVNLRSESISRADFERSQVLSWTSVIEVDCQARKARLGRTMSYRLRNLVGDGRETVAANPAWITPIPGGPADRVMLKVCDGKTINPLTGAGVRVAVAKPPAQAPTAQIAPPPLSKAAVAPAPKPAAPAPKPTVPPPPKPTAPKSKPVAPGKVLIQVAATGSEADAKRALAEVQKRRAPPAGVSSRVERTVVEGRTFYRAQFVGFASEADARAYCKAASPGCLVC